MKIDELKKCRICGKNVKIIYDFGDTYISGFINPGEDSPKAPMRIARCESCDLVQLGDTVDLDFLYKKQYWYASSLNKSMVESLKDVVDKTLAKLKLCPGDVAVDIGCNDGTLLEFYPEEIIRVGYEPAPNMGESAKKVCDYFIGDYFYSSLYPKELQKAKIITSIAMFYDLPDPNKFVRDIKDILADDGIWVIQLTDLTTQLELKEVSSFCHEHLEYYRLIDLINLMNYNGLIVNDLEYNKTNGGSLRIYVSKTSAPYPITDAVFDALNFELEYYNESKDVVKDFFSDLTEISRRVVEYLKELKSADIDVYGLGASTKGNTLLQFFGIDNTLIKAIGDVNPDKFGLVTAGTNIPIISEKELLEKNPKFIFLIIWQFRDNILKKLQPYIEKGTIVRRDFLGREY